MDIKAIEQAIESAIEQQIAEIKEKASTYNEAIVMARKIGWPKERPSHLGGKILKIISDEVVSRLYDESGVVPIKK